MNYKQLSEDISNWLADYLISNKLDCFCVLVSGGIDSAVVSTLCARSGIPTYCYGVPINSHSENNRNSELQLEWLSNNFSHVETKIVDLSTSYETFIEDIESEISPLARANTKSRLRMMFIYSQATTLNGLVVGTGNLQEDFICHFFTKYGDGGVDISPIGGLLKSQVRELGRYLGIPNEILTSSPTDGLWDDNRTDETQLGCSYEEIEQILPWFHNQELESDLSPRELEVLNRCRELYEKGKHKTLPIPVFKVDKEKYQ